MNQAQLELREPRIIKLIIDGRYKMLRHAILLIGILALLSYSKEVSDYRGSARYLKVVCVYIPLIAMCYINMNILVPRFFFRDQYLLYIASLFLLVVTFLTILSYVLGFFFPDGHLVSNGENAGNKRGFYEATVILIPIILVTTMIKLFQRWMKDNERISELKNVTLTMELNELRNQINPHFLFNMLNGIKALVRSDPDKATVVIMKLSEFLRYQLYENNEEKTPLRSEIDFLSNFLDLEKLRRDNLSVRISCHVKPPVLNRVFIPPNLFTSFVENAVKYSAVINGKDPYIAIDIEIVNGRLHFRCINSVDPGLKLADHRNSGLGLPNIRRRLVLLYSDNCTLETVDRSTEYIVDLTIPL